MYDQLHLYGNEADEESHDYERPARSHTIGGPPRALHKKPSQNNPSVKSDGHLPAMYQNKTAVTNKVKVFERLASRQNDDTASDNQMFYSDVRYWSDAFRKVFFLVSRTSVTKVLFHIRRTSHIFCSNLTVFVTSSSLKRSTFHVWMCNTKQCLALLTVASWEKPTASLKS